MTRKTDARPQSVTGASSSTAEQMPARGRAQGRHRCSPHGQSATRVSAFLPETACMPPELYSFAEQSLPLDPMHNAARARHQLVGCRA